VKKLICAAGQVAMLPLFFGVLMLPGKTEAWDSLACYQPSLFPDARLRLATYPEVALTTYAEEVNFGHPHQLAMNVVGKWVDWPCPGDTLTRVAFPVSGSLIATDPFTAGHLGANIFSNFGNPTTCRDISISCRASDVSVFPPPSYQCFGRNGFGAEFTFALTQVDESTDPVCSLFAEGGGGSGPPAARPTGSSIFGPPQ
jgi:hypothetical protein